VTGAIEVYPIGIRGYQIVDRKPVDYERTNTGWVVRPAGLRCWIHVETEEQAQQMCAAIAEVHR
jgi:hypothetical protein